MATFGFTGLAAAGSINDTGPDSLDTINTSVHNSLNLRNTNRINLTNRNWQGAITGSATVRHNTNAGDATSGDAMNDNSSNFSVNASNSGPTLGDPSGGMDMSVGDNSINDTGPSSANRITTTVSNRLTENNTNNVSVNNSNSQSATTGNATVSGNTNGGSATSGDASNSNSTSATVAASNSGPNFGGSMTVPTGSSGSISDNGPDSSDTILSRITNSATINNTNDVSVSNSNSQFARSGNATVSGNTSGGEWDPLESTCRHASLSIL